MYITLDEVKSQVAVHTSVTEHDDRLTRLIGSAEAWAEQFLNAPLSDYEESPLESPPSIPEDIKSALLLHVEAEFDRDDRLFELLLRRSENLLWPHRTELEV